MLKEKGGSRANEYFLVSFIMIKYRMFNVKTPLSTLNLDIRQDSDIQMWGGGGGGGHPDPEIRGMPGLQK